MDEDVGFSAEIQGELTKMLDYTDIDILPTGEVYLPAVRYRIILNGAFGCGGWTMIPLSDPMLAHGQVLTHYQLVCHGKVISESWGEADYDPNNNRMTYGMALETSKSNALMRCCKDLGIASQCWDKTYTEWFKKEYCEQYKDHKGFMRWRKKGEQVPQSETDFGHKEQGSATVLPPVMTPESIEDIFNQEPTVIQTAEGNPDPYKVMEALQVCPESPPQNVSGGIHKMLDCWKDNAVKAHALKLASQFVGDKDGKTRYLNLNDFQAASNGWKMTTYKKLRKMLMEVMKIPNESPF